MPHEQQMAIAELEQRMRPGNFSSGGFLGSNESLAEVLEEDRNSLKQLGLTCHDLAGHLENLIRAALQSKNHSTRVGHFTVTLTTFSGFQICPWSPNPDQGQCRAGGGVRYGHLDWRITNEKRQITAQGPGLLVHLIRDHQFFEGKASPYRISPEELAKLLDLDGR